ncbi:hypothetical protein [Pelagibius sp. Alg239-R121]|uniref:hypothetical protein n=1 Tax=Pelagibius sp. Alg239-R121 TaxID=2993448 RepID=UPI0024A73BDF|nr:hypothetical protein [Pelagibius sp. Alg239-R121]
MGELSQNLGAIGWLETIDFRTAISILAIGISVSTLYFNRKWHTQGRDRTEVRDHFDFDVREMSHEGLARVRKIRLSLLEAAYDMHAVSLDDWAGIQKELDRIRQTELGPTLYDVSQTLLRADREYGHLLPSINLSGIARPISDIGLEKIDEAYDALMEEVGNLITSIDQTSPTQSHLNTAALSSAFFDYDDAVRRYLNEIRTAIFTRKSRRDILS